MTLSLNNLTFIIVTFKSDHVIHECIESLPKESSIIIIENSNDLIFKEKLETKNSKIKLLFKKTKAWALQIILELNYVKQIMLL